ncbi:MAG TPA: hypothetical protein VIY56_15255 [Vicinamibacterales bacterium]
MAIFHLASRPIALLLVACTAPLAYEVARAEEDKKPSLSLKATPPVGFSPLKVRLVVDVRGGPDDYLEFYCPAIEWAWGDGTESESSEDCAPYEAGVSSIKRRWSTEHTFRQAGNYRVFFRLKQSDKVVAASSANIQVRPGVRDGFGD